MNIVCDHASWTAGLYRDIDKLRAEDPNVRICVISQSSQQVMEISDNLEKRYPTLSINKLTGADSGITKEAYFEHINRTLETRNVFLFSPVILIGSRYKYSYIDIYGLMSATSNSQRAFLQMIARCRNVAEPVLRVKKACACVY
jgi:hypothetical protein